MKTAIISCIVMSSFLFSCGDNANEKPKEQLETVIHEEHQHNNGLQTIELNNGEKWKANTEMTPYILESEKLLNNYKNSDYKMLAKQLKDKNNSLIKSCTMDGKSHDELHKWLLPHIELVEKLGKAESEQKANEIIDELKESFKIYNTYFQ